MESPDKTCEKLLDSHCEFLIVAHMAKTRVMSFSIDADLMPLIDAQAAAMGVSRSQYVNAALRDYLEQQAATVAAFSNPLIRDTFIQAMSQPGVLKSLASAMNEQLSSDQLQLFEQGMQAGAKIMSSGGAKKSKKSKKNRGK